MHSYGGLEAGDLSATGSIPAGVPLAVLSLWCWRPCGEDKTRR